MKSLLILFLLLLVWSFTLASLGDFPLLSISGKNSAQPVQVKQEYKDGKASAASATDSIHYIYNHKK